MSEEAGSAAPAEPRLGRVIFRVRTYLLLGTVLVLAIELATYALWGDAAAVRVALRQVPQVEGNKFICFLGAGITPAQKAAAVDGLKARFRAVYTDREEIPPERFIWAKSERPKMLGLDGGLLWSWVVRERDWLWFTAEFGYWKSDSEKGTRRATFIWLPGAWIRVSSGPVAEPKAEPARNH